MTDRTDRRARILDRGKKRFVLLYGVLCWGVGTALLFSLTLPLAVGRVEWGRGVLMALVPALVLFPLGGLLWGSLMWNWMERQDRQRRKVGRTRTAKLRARGRSLEQETHKL